MRAPLSRFGVWCVCLENEPEPELELTHSNRGAWGRIGLDVRDLACGGVAEAIQALIARNRKHRMVEDVVCIEAEFKPVPFGETEGLQQRQVVIEGMRPPIRVELHVADLAASGQRKRTRRGPRECAGIHPHLRWRYVIRERSHRLEPVHIAVRMSDARREVSGNVRPAWAGI